MITTVYTSRNPLKALPVNPKVTVTSPNSSQAQAHISIGGTMQPLESSTPTIQTTVTLSNDKHQINFNLATAENNKDIQAQLDLQFELHSYISILYHATKNIITAGHSTSTYGIQTGSWKIKYVTKDNNSEKITVEIQRLIAYILSKFYQPNEIDINSEYIADIDLAINFNLKKGSNQFCLKIKLFDGLICITFIFDAECIKEWGLFFTRLLDNLKQFEVSAEKEIYEKHW